MRKPGGRRTPDIRQLQTEEVAVIDNLSGRLYLIVWADPRTPDALFQGKRRLAELTDQRRFLVTAPQVRRCPDTPVAPQRGPGLFNHLSPLATST